MGILALMAAQQAKNKIDQGYTDLPPDATGDFSGLTDTWNFAETSISNLPNVANDAIQGVMELVTDPKAREQLYTGLSDLTLGAVEKLNDGPLFDTEQGIEQAPKRIETADQAIDAVKEAFSSNRKTRETLSQNPDLLAGGLWGAAKAGKFAGKHLGPTLADKTEKMLTDQGLIKYVMPPDSKTFGKGDAYTTGEFLQLGQFPQGELSRMAHKFRGREGYMSEPGYGKGISETDFIRLMKSDGAAFQAFGVNNLEEAIDMLQGKVGLDRLEEMMAGSMVTLEKPLYIERAEGYGGAKDTPVSVKDTSLYSATMIDPANEAIMKMGSAYGKNPYIIKLEAGTQIYHPSGNADLSELVVKGKDINKSQGMKKSDYKVESKRKLGDTLFDWDQIDKERKGKKIDEGLLSQTPKQTKTLYHTSAKELDIGNKKEPAWFALEEKHATDGWAKNLEFEGEKPHVYKTEFTGNLIKRNDARKLFNREGLDFDDYEAFLTENPGSKEVLSMKGTQLLKKEGFDGLEYLDYDPRNFQKDLIAAIVFEPKKVISSSKRIKQLNKKPPKFKQGILDFD